MAADNVRVLMKEARNGSVAAMGELLETHRRYLLAVANRELPRELWAKVSPSDIVQNSMLEACQGFPAFAGRTREELAGWLRRILLHNLGDVRRSYQTGKKRQLARERQIAQEVAAEDRPLADRPQVRSRERSPSSYAASHEEAVVLDRALRRLAVHDRTVILLRNREGLSFPAIGQYMGRSDEAVRKLWASAVERLREKLDQGA
jgi:RNA polymerase sigma-70 factor (ECF subfamily)